MEKKWEIALASQQKVRADHERFTRTSPCFLTPAERQTITALAGGINGL
ncbi:hypothetical protein AB0Q95_44775 [Streptomyces sp. NPDC059900]